MRHTDRTCAHLGTRSRPAWRPLAALALLLWIARPAAAPAEEARRDPARTPFTATPESLDPSRPPEGLQPTSSTIGDGSRADPFERDPFDDLVIPSADTPAEQEALALELETQGRQALESHRYDDAARRLETSYRVVARTRLLAPLARALELAGRYAAAAERLSRFLDESDDLAPDERLALERELQTLQRRYALVSVTSDPEGADLSIDGRALGSAPLLRPLTLNHGHYLIEARLEGFRDAARRIAVAGGDPLDVVIRLDPIERDRGRGLETALWITTALTAASAVAWVTTAVIGARWNDELSLDPAPDEVDRFESMSAASYGLAGTTGALGVTAVVLAVIHAVGGRDADE